MQQAKVVAVTSAPRAILWDVMDTLVVDPFRQVMPSFFGMTLAELLEHKHPTAWVCFERSELSEAELKEVLLLSAIYCGVPAANTAFHRAAELVRPQ